MKFIAKTLFASVFLVSVLVGCGSSTNTTDTKDIIVESESIVEESVSASSEEGVEEPSVEEDVGITDEDIFMAGIYSEPTLAWYMVDLEVGKRGAQNNRVKYSYQFDALDTVTEPYWEVSIPLVKVDDYKFEFSMVSVYSQIDKETKMLGARLDPSKYDTYEQEYLDRDGYAFTVDEKNNIIKVKISTANRVFLSSPVMVGVVYTVEMQYTEYPDYSGDMLVIGDEEDVEYVPIMVVPEYKIPLNVFGDDMTIGSKSTVQFYFHNAYVDEEGRRVKVSVNDLPDNFSSFITDCTRFTSSCNSRGKSLLEVVPEYVTVSFTTNQE